MTGTDFPPLIVQPAAPAAHGLAAQAQVGQDLQCDLHERHEQWLLNVYGAAGDACFFCAMGERDRQRMEAAQ